MGKTVGLHKFVIYRETKPCLSVFNSGEFAFNRKGICRDFCVIFQICAFVVDRLWNYMGKRFWNYVGKYLILDCVPSRFVLYWYIRPGVPGKIHE